MRAIAPSQSFAPAYSMPAPYGGYAWPQLAPAVPASGSDEEDVGFSVVTIVLALLGGALAGFVCASGTSPWMASGVIVMVLAACAVVNPRACIIMTIVFLTV